MVVNQRWSGSEGPRQTINIPSSMPKKSCFCSSVSVFVFLDFSITCPRSPSIFNEHTISDTLQVKTHYNSSCVVQEILSQSRFVFFGLKEPRFGVWFGPFKAEIFKQFAH